MPVSIPLTGLASNDPVPGQFVEINFAVGPASSGQNTYSAVILANKTSAGSATVDSVVYGPDTATPLVSETDAINLFGAGSEAHRMFAAFLKVNQSTPLYVVAVTESAGAQATGTITVTGPATSAGTIRVQIGSETVDAGFISGDSATTMAVAVKAAINANISLPVTADNSSGVITITAKQRGLRGNLIRYSARIIPNSATGAGVSPTAQTAMTGGTTADSNTTALATILPSRYYYIVSASGYESQSATQFAAVVSQVGTQALPINGIRQRAICGTSDTLANATTFATGLNSARAEVVWLANSDVVPCELAANNAAVYALEEAPSIPRCNFSGYGNDAQSSVNWKIPQPVGVAGPTRTQLVSALNNGLTPIAVGKSGRTYLVKRITSKSLNGSTSDFRIRDSHKVTVMDRYADDLVTKYQLNFTGKLLSDDPERGARIPGSNVVTPRVLKAAIDQLTREYAENDLLENEASTRAATIVVRESGSPNRISARVPLDAINILDQVATAIDQIG